VDWLFQAAWRVRRRSPSARPAEFTLDLVPTIVNWLLDHLKIAA
jgi:hypothetical protein